MTNFGSDLPALAELLEYAGDGIILTDGDAQIRWVSSGVSHLFGYEPEKLIGRDLHALLPVRFRQSHARRMKAFRDGVTESRSMAGSRVVLGLNRSGHEIPLSATISRLDGGRMLGVCLHDATERAALELEQAERLERARDLADHLPVLVSYLDVDLRHRFVNGAYADWMGVPRGALEGEEMRSDLGEEGWMRLAPHLRRGLEGERSRMRMRLRDREGRARTLDVLVAPAEDSDGSVTGLMVAALEVPAAERSGLLRTVSGQAGRLLSATVDPFLSLASVLHMASQTLAERAEACISIQGDMCRVLASERDAQVPSDERIPARELPQGLSETFTDGVSRCYSSRTDRWTYLTHAIRVEGVLAGVLKLSWDPPHDPSLEEREIAEDLASRIGGAFERANAHRRAREAALQRDWVLERALHDLSGPTASIWMVADRMLRSAPDPDRRRRSRAQIEGIAQQAKELERLILDLKAATTLRVGHAITMPTPIDVHSLLMEVIDTLEPLTTWHETILELGPGGPEGTRVLADPYHLRRLVSALVMNAARSSGPGEAVEIACEGDADNVTFLVRGPDSACPAESDHGTAPSLDLAIAHEIAESQGAGLAFRRNGRSCVASFTLPRAS
jgi:PAS domain S-box-containing protein